LKAKFIGFGIPFTEFSFLNFSNHSSGKSLSSKDSDQVYNQSLEFIREYFKENEFRAFVKRGISYILVNCEKA
jgi:hypothetical protein